MSSASSATGNESSSISSRLNEAPFSNITRSYGTIHETSIQRRGADLKANTAAIHKQEISLAKQTAALSKDYDKYSKVADGATDQLKMFGDLQNWAECMERDLVVLEETLRLAEGREEAGLASGTVAWK